MAKKKKTKRKAVVKVVKVNRKSLETILSRLNETIQSLEIIDFDGAGKSDKYVLSDALVSLIDIENDLGKELDA